MKIIQAMRQIEANRIKLEDLRKLIKDNCANLSHETPLYGDKTAEKIAGWAQACHDIGLENMKLQMGIWRANIATKVTIKIGDKEITKSIAEWILRRQEYANSDYQVWDGMGDRGLREGEIKSSVPGQESIKVKIVRYFDPNVRDQNKALFKEEPSLINGHLEVVNAVTDIIID